MRVMLTVSSWPTHYASMVPLGWAFQAAGHDVRVLCPESQTNRVGGAGLTPVPVLGGMDVVTRLRLQYYREAVDGVWPYPWLPPHPVTGVPLADLGDFDAEGFRRDTAPVLAARAARGFDATVAFARAWRPELVLHDPASLEGLLAARVTGVPGIVSLWGPVGTREPEHMRIVPDDHSGSFPRHGLGELSLDMIDNAVDPCPGPLAPETRARRLPVRYVPYNGNAPAPPWLLEPPRRRRVCVTWSTALSTMSGPDSYLLPTLVDALGDTDFEIIVTATAQDAAALRTALGTVPPSVRVAEHLPLRVLVPSCDVIVHHGGSGSALTSLWAGVPQLIVTFASEQTATGRRVAAAGAARHLLGHRADRATVRHAVEEIASDSRFRSAAAALRAEMFQQPTPARLVDTLAELAAVPG